jgi:soluble lytic murein transglycosylase-like protein
MRSPTGCAVTLRQRSLPLSFVAVLASAALFLSASEEAHAPPSLAPADLPALSCVPDETFDEADVPAQAVLVKYLSRRYQIAAEATERMVGAAFSAAREVGLDPFLVLAVIAVESRFNPIAESGVGAKGLMQIIPKYHHARLAGHGGEAALLDPESNIRLGAQILQEYVDRTGTLQAGLQFYNGASADASAVYARKVMAERERLMQAVGQARRFTTVALHGS